MLQTSIQERSDFRTRLEIYFEETLIAFLEEHESMQICYAEIIQLFPHAGDGFPKAMLEIGQILTDYVTRGQEAGIVRKDIDPDIVSGLIHDRVCN